MFLRRDVTLIVLFRIAQISVEQRKRTRGSGCACIYCQIQQMRYSRPNNGRLHGNQPRDVKHIRSRAGCSSWNTARKDHRTQRERPEELCSQIRPFTWSLYQQVGCLVVWGIVHGLHHPILCFQLGWWFLTFDLGTSWCCCRPVYR